MTARLNIYLPDVSLRRTVKTAAAARDISISEYCVRAITNQLERDGAAVSPTEGSMRLSTAVEKARRFQAETFRGETFKVSSADLIRRAREERPA